MTSGSTNGYSYHQWQSGNDWGYVSAAWKLKKNKKTDDTAAINREARKPGFGEYADWAYAEAIVQKQGYAQFMLGETEAQCPEKIRFVDWVRYEEAGIAIDVNNVALGWEMKNMPTIGGGG